ncbi:AraC family transcriptional regulator [Paenibacillus koleovorans]|uniref:AraC family transcriptional regulator n=1 Tax=Paenibacillus koleovorans TaxID=121608 RepID=UPI000FD6F674|nr:AraC family transcriptional regulator [Paenibacillus koleovorans]
MTTIPDYQDVLANANVRRGQLPFLIRLNTIEPYCPLHHHDVVELSFVLEGSGIEIINEEKHVMKPGTASFLLPHHIHSIACDPGKPIRLYCCMFDISMLYGSPFDYELVGQLLRSGSESPSYVEFNREQMAHVTQIFADMLTEYNSAEFGKFSFIRSKLMEVLLLFCRIQRLSKLHESPPVSAVSSKKMWDIILYIHLHYTEKLTLESLASRFNYSPTHVGRAFKKLCGHTFLDYLHLLRITNALSLLISTNMAITDISAEVGFDSFRSFSRVFKQYKGMSPSDYRKSKSLAN